jgi:hypothetical protein
MEGEGERENKGGGKKAGKQVRERGYASTNTFQISTAHLEERPWHDMIPPQPSYDPLRYDS